MGPGGGTALLPRRARRLPERRPVVKGVSEEKLLPVWVD